MRVLIVTFPWKTHLFNMVPLAWSLRTAGHEVRVASEPDLLDVITGTGLTAVSVGSGEALPERIRRAWREGTLPPIEDAPPLGEPAPLFDISPDREPLSWQQVKRIYDTLVVPRARLFNDAMMDDLVDVCREWKPDLVLWNAVTYAGAIAATAVGAVHARLLYSVDVYTRMREDYLYRMAQQSEADRTDGLKDWVSGHAERHGVEFSEDLINGHFTIDPLPEPFRLEHRLTSLPMQFVPHNGKAVVPRWIEEKPKAPRVLMTFGVSANDWPELFVFGVEQMQAILDAVADLEMELVVTLPKDFQAQLQRVPDNTRLEEFVPLSAIMPTCSAVLHHGGAGSFGTAMRYGVPQMMISQALDAPLKFKYIDKSGIGVWLKPEDADAAGVRAGLVKLLRDDSYRKNAERLGQEVMSMPSPNELVHTIENLVADHRAGAVPATR